MPEVGNRIFDHLQTLISVTKLKKENLKKTYLKCDDDDNN